MTDDDTLRRLAMLHGVHADFHDLHGHRHVASPDTLRALLTALGVSITSPASVQDALDHHAAQPRDLPAEIIALAGQTFAVDQRKACTWVLLDEQDATIAEGRAEGAIALPALAVGYYRLIATQAEANALCRVLVRPRRAPDLADQGGAPKRWGMTAALYGLRSDDNGGLGNFKDLGTLATTLGAQGAAFVGINPVHALGWAMHDIISPYSPSHRGFLNIDHIAVPTGLGPGPDADLIDHPAFRARHRAALEQRFATFDGHKDQADFAAWRAAAGSELEDFARFEAISETHGYDFRTWPTALQTPGKAAQTAAGARTDFHAWLQWLAETQIGAAQAAATGSGMSLGLYLDLAVGPRPDGAEVWMNADTIAKGVSIGAPPDHLSPEGQSWALAAHAPGPLAQSFYAPLRMMLRRLMAHCGLVRIDHVLGLMRSFWLPDNGAPGGYISQPLDALLAVITIEAHRASCVVVGEDLGLVPEGFRAQINAAGLYSYAVWQFEGFDDGTLRPTRQLAAQALACFGTHDTPTLRGFWHGCDIEWWEKVGWLKGADRQTRHARRARQRNSLRDLCHIAPLASARDISDAVHGQLAQAPSALVCVQLDDALGLTEAQNLPGTVDAHPNWRRRLPISVDALATAPGLAQVANLMSDARKPVLNSSTEDKKVLS